MKLSLAYSQSIQHAHAIKLAEKNRSQKVVDGEGIVGMTPHDLLKLLHRPVVIEVVKMTERSQVGRIMGSIGK